MGVTFAAITTVIVLSAWHLRIRRHPSWSVSGDGRFYIMSGYPMMALAVYWLTASPTSTEWEWALGNMWALAAMISFVYGVNALDSASHRRRAAAHTIESIPQRLPDGAHDAVNGHRTGA
ncbi:hypothetical protein [Mycolicibacterium komossense]|uniref:Uncharacterized protein n=1 Tax=Mycolicibacterium komossense TaxID=1779 RepID=A0ABT3CCD3_9MYCO|nr:hypothetical protein [Mycolicibacterium komossense]MCV7227159.1 hypothetical protein [Mycolicibacterium komossense]